MNNNSREEALIGSHPPHGEIRRNIRMRKLLLPFLNLRRKSLQMVNNFSI